MAYTYDNFVSAANAAGLMNQFSEQDLQIAQRNPEFGLSLLSLLKDNSNATTAEQQLLATEAANQLRKSYGVYNTGTLGTDSAYAGSYGTQINDLMDQIKNYGSFDYANQDEYQKLLDQITNYGSFSYANQDSYQQLLDSIVNQQPFSYDLQSDPSWGSYKKAYMREGDRASANALAQASAASGGRASSYALTAAQQAGNYYAGQLADIIPTLEQNAYSRYLSDFNPNWTQTNKAFKFVFGGGAITAMDGWAASTLWPWAENKVRREHPELAVGTKAQVEAGESAFYKKVAEEFEIAVSRSQSVSDEIHQGALRKSKNPITKAFTMFRSDSAQTYNALRQKIGEAWYYMRTGAKEKVIQTAKKAAGTAFVAMLINAAWSEAVSFLMALWKNKGKYYRDDEDELTVQSVAGEMVSNMLGSYAGVVTGGEELFELIGNIITGDTWYGIETPGMEQLNDLLDTLIESGSGMRDLVAGGWDVLKNGGNLGDYFSKHSGEMLGGIKDLAEAAAMYLSGMPASNLEAYLTGALKWISPELGAAYDDLFSDTGKSDLAGMEGSALEGRIGRILSDRNVSESDDTAAALAALYEAGHKIAIPSDTPTSVSIDGEKHSLGEYQQQAYDTIWGGIVADALDDMVASDSFKEADPKTQAKMLSNLYAYAAEQAKAELFDEYELDSGAAKNAAIVAAGATVAECITWNTITSEMKSGEKSAELASWDIPEEAKREIFRCKISDSREDSIAAFDEAGLSFDQFLQAYSMYGQINNEDLKAGMKAVEFSHWVNAQDYTAKQAAVVKDELTYFNMTPASSSRYDELVGAGMDPDEAYDLTGALNELQPEDGADEVSDLQKWRASVDFSDDVEDQLAALSAVMTDAQFLKVEIANNFGVSPDAYVTLQEIKSQYDADGNGSYKNAEIQAAVDGLPGYYTTEQKAVLWQLATGSTSARNNPYSRQVGQQVLDARAAAKEAAAQEQTEAPTDSTDDDSFSQALLNQLLGRG